MTVRYLLAAAAAIAGLLACPLAAHANDASDATRSNNPLNPAPGFNIQNYYVPRIYGTDSTTNDFLLRGTLPIAPGETIPVPQLLRLTVPISTRPDPRGGNAVGLGDINIFDIFLFKAGELQLGAGPLLTIPTATSDPLGTGKWQGGVAAVVVDAKPGYLMAGLLQWQQSFAGDSDRPDVATVTVQPIFNYNLADGWYARSTAIWSFNIRNGRYVIPVGVGAGKVWRAGTTIMNAFIEPQFTMAHDGDGQPKLQIFGGLNLTLK